jgi:arylformamidase
MPNNWIDISVTVRPGMVTWPDNPPVRVDRVMQMEQGDVCNVSNLSLGAHTGTHMDGLLHFIANGKGLEKMPLDATIGPARVIEIKDRVSIKPADLIPHRLKKGERILFKTRNSKRSWKMDRFDEDFIYIAQEAAQLLVNKGVQTVGVDYLSVGGFKKDGVETHQILLGAGVWVIEGLNLAKVAPGKYDLICLPVKIDHSDGAPARAILRPR